MGVNTIGVAATVIKDVFFVARIVEKSLSELVKEYRTGFGDEENRLPSIELNTLGFLVFQFSYKGEHRSLHLHFTCDGDYGDAWNGPKIIWTLGAWGSAEYIIMKVCKAMVAAGFDTVFFQPEDTRDDNWIQVGG